tara:strand:- start:209 stop:409 length:201 start_codon:yes stop_codon:yes gene_type:complete
LHQKLTINILAFYTPDVLEISVRRLGRIIPMLSIRGQMRLELLREETHEVALRALIKEVVAYPDAI